KSNAARCTKGGRSKWFWSNASKCRACLRSSAFLMSPPLAVLLAPARQRERRMGSNREEIEEKLRVLLNDVRRDKQSDTLHQRAITEMGQEYAGRFSRLRAEQQIIGTTAIAYPQLPSSSPWASDPLGPEMRIDATDCGDRLNYSIDALG